MRFFTSILSIAAFSTLATATLDPATSNTKGYYPSSPACTATKVSKAIQAAECAYNTRVSGTQTFAVFETDHQYDSSHGAPYGTCSAYTCTAPTKSELKAGADYWVFYWGSEGTSSGVGTTCIKSPVDGTCGCENSTGEFVYGGTDCV
ncbi:putative small secreted protein [Botrytis fragariae]|uniref:Putative small secreted protein n=1 Tax=Botrytis fragariae TaxID=1964551 RepID=A0A8H6ATT1_9HELO|nr:putative small secreted protein [Botrytis fragariae]KAF5873448.1 putative small secreted protein [Botrytis fragariae]